MKKNIIRKQYKELSRSGKFKYVEWCMKKGYEREHCKSCGVISDMLDIGQMIEFLGFIPRKVPLTGVDFICDALWEACKEVLEK